MIKRLLFFIAFLAAVPTFAQGVYVTEQVTEVATVSTATNVVTIPAGPIVVLCNAPASGAPCTNRATTYTDSTLGTSCPTSTQIVLAGTNNCVASPDAQNNLGWWVPSGQYAYTITVNGVNLGPYYVTAGGTNGGSGPSLQTNGTPNGSQSLLNLQSGSNVTVTDNGVGGVTIAAAASTGASLTADNTFTNNNRFKGPIPFRDFTAYMPPGGCSTTGSGVGANAMGTIGAGSSSLVLSTASDFKNGCGIAVLNAGPLATLTAPPGSLVSPATASVSNTVTVTVSGGHGLVVGSGTGLNQGVVVTGCTNSAYNGTYPIATVPNSTTFTYVTAASGTGSTTTCAINPSFGYAHGATGSTTYNYKIASVDSSMGMSAASSAITITNGNASLTKYNYNHVMWPTVTGAYEFVIYSDLGIGGAYSCVGTAFTNGYSDKGLGMPCPAFAPATPPASATARTLNTTIVSGAGGTTLILAAPATTLASSKNVYHDESSFLTSCVNDALLYGLNGGYINTNEYGCVIPAGAYTFNGPMPTELVSTANKSVYIHVEGSILLQTIPWIISQNGYSLIGGGSGAGFGQFQSKIGTTIYATSPVAAAVVVDANSIEVSGFSIQSFGDALYDVAGAAHTFNNDTLEQNGTAGSALHLDNSILYMHGDNDSMYGSGAGGQGTIEISGSPYFSAAVCCVYFNNLTTYNHSVEVAAPGGNGSIGGGHNGFFFTNWLQENLVMADVGDITFDGGANATNSNGSTNTALSNLVIKNLNDSDTSGTAVIAYSGATSNINTVTLENITVGTTSMCVNNSVVCNGNGAQIPAFFSVNGPLAPGAMGDTGNGFSVANSYGNVSNNPLYFTDWSQGGAKAPWAMLLPKPSTFSVTGTAGSGGTLAAGVYCAAVTGVDVIGSETLPSNTVCQTVVSTGTISYQWYETTFYTYTSFNFYECFIASGTCTPNKVITGITGSPDPIAYTFTTPSVTTQALPVQAKAFLSWLKWDYQDAHPSCFYCSLSHSDSWPVGFGIIPTVNAGFNIYTKLGINVGGVLQVAGTSTLATVNSNNNSQTGGNAFGAAVTYNVAACETSFAPTTVSGGATTTTGLTCLPANAIIDAVAYRITTTITTAVSFTIGDSGSATRYCGTQSTMTVGTTGTCTAAGYYLNASALGVKITPNTTPGAGAIRLLVFYHTWAAPTS